MVEEYIPSKTTKKHIELAERVANQSIYSSFKHGAVLTKSGAVINASCNKNGFNSFGARFRKKEYGRATLHAELGAILNVERSKTEGSTVYVVRVNKKGEKRLSKPCHMCQSALQYCGIKKVIYSTNEGYEIIKL